MTDLVAAASQNLPERVREALWARGVTDEQISLYSLGYLHRKLPVGCPESFTKWGSVDDRLDDVILLPLTNALGDVRGVQLRHVARERGGYMNYIEVNDEAIFFGLGQAAPHMWAEQSAFLVEGAFDLFPVQRVFPGTVSTLTARVTDPFLRLLRRLVTRVWLGYDMDDAGRRACERYQKSLSSEFVAKVVLYPRVQMVGTGKLIKDPSDLWETWGDTRFQEFIRALLGTQKESTDAQDLR
jgi:DNA primase